MSQILLILLGIQNAESQDNIILLTIMKESLFKVGYWFYIKFLFFYKYILHKKRTKSLMPVSLIYRLRQIIELSLIAAAIGAMVWTSYKFLR